MFVVDWFKDMLYQLGLWKKSGKILFLGLDNAGKTTLLKVLKEGRITQADPTKHVHSEELELGSIRIKAFDLGGHDIARKSWKGYFPGVDGIIYLIDSSALDRIEETKKELYGLLEVPELSKVPVVVLGNKIDKKDAMSEETLRQALGLETFSKESFDSRPIELFKCSVAKKVGYAEAFNWLSKDLK